MSVLRRTLLLHLIVALCAATTLGVFLTYLRLSRISASLLPLAEISRLSKALSDESFRLRLAVDTLVAERTRSEIALAEITFQRERVKTLEAAVIGLKAPALQAAIARQVNPEDDRPQPIVPTRWERAAGLPAPTSNSFDPSA